MDETYSWLLILDTLAGMWQFQMQRCSLGDVFKLGESPARLEDLEALAAAIQKASPAATSNSPSEVPESAKSAAAKGTPAEVEAQTGARPEPAGTPQGGVAALRPDSSASSSNTSSSTGSKASSPANYTPRGICLEFRNHSRNL